MSRSATRLHAAGREAERELRPDERRDVVADDAIEDAASALRVVEVLVELARVRRRRAATPFFVISWNSTRCDLEAWPLELLRDVPRDGLAFAIGVGREQDVVGLLGRGLELGQDLLLALDDLVRLREVLLDVDAHLLGQVLDVTLRGEDLVARAQVLLDRLRLRRRLDDDECLGSCQPWTLTFRAQNNGGPGPDLTRRAPGPLNGKPQRVRRAS